MIISQELITFFKSTGKFESNMKNLLIKTSHINWIDKNEIFFEYDKFGSICISFIPIPQLYNITCTFDLGGK